MKHRLFIAIPLGEAERKKLYDQIVLPDSFRKTGIENLHITVLFLGDTEEEKISSIINKLKNLLSGSKSFTSDIDHLGQFPAKGTPNIIYASGKINVDKMKKLASDIRVSMKDLGFVDEKEFKYHITVGRKKNDRNEKIIFPVLKEKIDFVIEKVILYKSELTRQGPMYTKLQTFNLKD